MKVGDLVRVSCPGITPFVGIVTKLNDKGGALVRGFEDWLVHPMWAGKWMTEIINESR